MRKNKLSTAGLVAVLSVALISGGAYAWFINQDTAAEVNVSTGSVKIDLDDLKVVDSEILPGESSAIVNAADEVAGIENTGSKSVAIELNLGNSVVGEETLKAYLPAGADPTQSKDWKPEFEGQYIEEDLNGETRYRLSEERLAAVASLVMDSGTNQTWGKVDADNKYYTVLASKETMKLEGLKLELKDELGGGVGQKGSLSDSRQFEQQTQFVINISALATQANADAVKSQFSDEAYDALITAGFTF